MAAGARYGSGRRTARNAVGCAGSAAHVEERFEAASIARGQAGHGALLVDGASRMGGETGNRNGKNGPKLKTERRRAIHHRVGRPRAGLGVSDDELQSGADVRVSDRGRERVTLHGCLSLGTNLVTFSSQLD